MSHTPGPWKFLPGQDNQALHQDDPVAGTIYSTGTELHIARIWSDVDEGDAEANARLIAAAPDLLAALTELYALVLGEAPRLLDEDSGGDANLDLKIEAAIAKAKGEA